MDSPPDFDSDLPGGAVDPLCSQDFQEDPSPRFRAEAASVDSPSPSEAFQMLANEVRIQILLTLFEAEDADDGPVSFSSLQSSIGLDDSARFAYHVRQLVDHYIEKRQDGYALTLAGRQAAIAVIDGSFTNGSDGNRAS